MEMLTESLGLAKAIGDCCTISEVGLEVAVLAYSRGEAEIATQLLAALHACGNELAGHAARSKEISTPSSLTERAARRGRVQDYGSEGPKAVRLSNWLLVPFIGNDIHRHGLVCRCFVCRANSAPKSFEAALDNVEIRLTDRGALTGPFLFRHVCGLARVRRRPARNCNSTNGGPTSNRSYVTSRS